MKIVATLFATCCLIQASVASVRRGSMSRLNRNLQGENVVPWSGPDMNFGINGHEEIAIINTSGSGSVLIYMDISHLGSLEASGSSKDTLLVFFKVDNDPEELWLDVAGDKYSSPAQKTVAAGSQLTIRTVGDTSYIDEVYQIRNFAVTEVNPSLPTDAPATRPPSVCGIPKVRLLSIFLPCQVSPLTHNRL